MKNNRVILFFTLLAVLLLLYLMFGGSVKQRYFWWETYEDKSVQPYAVFFVKELLRDYATEGFEVLEDSVPPALAEGEEAAMVYVGSVFPPGWSDEDLLNFVRNGHTLFIVSMEAPVELLRTLCEKEDAEALAEQGYEEFYDSWAPAYNYYVDTAFTFVWQEGSEEKTFSLSYRDRYARRPYEWASLWLDHLCPCVSSCLDILDGEESDINFYGYPPLDEEDARMKGFPASFFEGFRKRVVDEGVGTTERAPVFGFIPYGKGRIYLHSVPLAFTNYALTQDQGFEYVSHVFSKALSAEGKPAVKKIYWVNPKHPNLNVAHRPSSHFGRTPLKYVLSQPSLAWAWYLLLASALLYVLFVGKRRQREMPLLTRPENTSMAFVALIGQLTFLRGDHRQLAMEMLRLWSGYVHRHYQLSLLQDRPGLAETLASRSGVSPELIQKIFSLRQKIENSSYFSEVTLVSLYKLLQEFYKNEKRNYA